jgi:hypothetical protein
MNSELERRIRLDFTKRKTDLLPYIQTYFPDVSATQFKQWEDAGALESRRIDGETYYFIDSEGKIIKSKWTNHEFDDSRYILGNCFKTQQEAEKEKEKRLEMLKEINSIWKQIDNGNENDYIHFHLRRADGEYLPVLDHGRIVESQQYGKVFYVLFMDWEDMNSHYSEKFSG